MIKTAADLHNNVPPNWYYDSIGKNLLQRYWHTRRFVEIRKLIEKVDGKILDVGSADGVFTKIIFDAARPSKVIGVDVLDDSVAWANKHWKNKKMKFVVADAHNLPFSNDSFDAAFSLEMLEHVFKPVDVLKEIKRVMKEGAYAIFLVPSESVLFKVVWFLWRKFGRGGIWHGTHIQDYSKKTLRETCESVGFSVEVDNRFLLGMLNVVKVRKN